MRTPGCLLLALQVQGAAAPPGASGDIVALILASSPVAKAVLVILLIFSVASWAIVLAKALAYRQAASQTSAFLEVFRRSTKFSEVQAACKAHERSPLVGLFLAGYAEINAQLKQPAASGSSAATMVRPVLRSLTAVDRALLRAASVEMQKLEARVTFLATTASITPFIGLFGTVWGIMAAFQGIGAQGSTDLSVVAPGISEALVATAFGLFAAIPAVYFYNLFTSQVKSLGSEMDDFALEFLNICERNFT